MSEPTDKRDGRKEVEPMDMTNTCVAVAPPTISGRVSRWLFPRRHLWPLEEAEEAQMLADGFAPGELMTTTHVHLDLLDRLRVLFSGKLRVDVRSATDKIVDKMQSRSTTYVLAPWEKW